MKKNWLWLLAAGLSACGQPLEIAPEVALKHQHEAALQRQIQLLQAKQVKVSATAAVPKRAGLAILTLEVINPQPSPAQPPDTLQQRVHKLAHLLVADLASPGQYQAVSAQATFRPSFFSRSSGASTSSQAFIYSTASLR